MLANKPQCVITGCTLRAPDFFDNHLNGDLFKVGDVYIFNGNPTELPPGQFEYERTVLLDRDSEYFHRRHVVVFRASEATFNDAAVEYMA